MTGPHSHGDSTNTYQAPRYTPHPSETPIDPYNETELRELEESRYKRDLLLVAKKIRTTEAQLRRHLSRLGKSSSDDPRKAVINVNRIMVMRPGQLPTARRAKTAQNNLDNHYRRWAMLCEEHLRAINHRTGSQP